jgi:pyrimidine-nucleoside phosphorylase
MMSESISSGRALEKFGEIVEAQGGDARIVDDYGILPSAAETAEFAADRDGSVLEIAPRAVGHGIISLRGGRRTMEDRIDPSVGFVITAKPGDRVSRGDVLATIHAIDEAGIREGKRVLSDAISIGDGDARSLPLVSHRISSEGMAVWTSPVPD